MKKSKRKVKSQKKKPSKGNSTNSILSLLDKRPQTARDMLFVTVGFESNGKSRTVRTTFPEDALRSDTTLEILIQVAVGAIDSWVETSKPMRDILNLVIASESFKNLKKTNIESLKIIPGKKKSAKDKPYSHR